MNVRSRCGQSFTNLAQQMNVLYSAEQKGRPLGSQALGGALQNCTKVRSKGPPLLRTFVHFWRGGRGGGPSGVATRTDPKFGTL